MIPATGTHTMKFFCCFTQGHEALFLNYFKPSLPEEIDLQPTLLPGAGAGDFLSKEFLECISRKMNLVVDSIRAHSGELIVWTDIDIIFFRPVVAELERLLAESGKEILFQRETKQSSEVNTGFFVCRCSERLAVFFETVRQMLQDNPKINEQIAINRLLGNGCELDFGYLPCSYYARTQHWPPPKDLAIYHANGTKGKNGQKQKVRQFKEVYWIRRHGPVALALSCAAKFPRWAARPLGRYVRRKLAAAKK